LEKFVSLKKVNSNLKAVYLKNNIVKGETEKDMVNLLKKKKVLKEL